MGRLNSIAVVAACCAFLAAGSSSNQFLQLKRSSPSDLEITGMIEGIEPGGVRYVSYEHLLTLPQVTVSVTGDDNFAELPQERINVTGVYLDVLAKALGAMPESDLMDALCSDGYRTNYPRSYILTHRPIFALKINGQRVQEWAAQKHIDDPGPYFITHAHFVPSFNVLSLEELPQIPAQMVQLEFSSSQRVYGAIAPRGNYAADSDVMLGYRIAKQHCYRCHNMGSHGGTKAGKSWETLGARADKSPAYFVSHIRDPQSVDPKATMPANANFDDATVQALTAYFKNFSTGVQ